MATSHTTNWAPRPVLLVMMLLCVAFTGTGCDIHDYTPRETEITDPRSGTHTFVVDHTGFVGLYGNIDSNCQLFSYVTSQPNADSLWSAVDTRATEVKWNSVQSSTDSRTYERIRNEPKGSSLTVRDEVRMHFDSKTRRVLVGYGSGEDSELWQRWDEARRTAIEQQ